MELMRGSKSESISARQVKIVGVGTATAVGINASMTAASVRANLSRFKTSDLIDRAGEPIVLSMVEYLHEALRGLDRLSALAIPAAQEAVAPLLTAGLTGKQFSPVLLCLGLATARPGFDPDRIKTALFDRLRQAVPFIDSEGVILACGHAAGLMGIGTALRWIATGKADAMLVGGIDSYFDADTLEWLDQNKRLHSEANKDGFVPGEAAGFCLLASAGFAQRHRLKSMATILSAVSGEEPQPSTSDGICIGKGLTAVLREALDVVPPGEKASDWTICDLNGECFRATDWAYAYLRTGPRHRDPLEIWHPADCYGDIGAASGAVLTAISVAAWERGYARGNRCLIWSASDAAERSAVLAERALSTIKAGV